MSERQLPPQSHWPDVLEPEFSQGLPPPPPAWAVHRPLNRPWLHLALFLITVVSTMYMGSLHYAGFATDFVQDAPSTSFFQGAWYSFTILAILGTHEMGHYFACRYYGVDASLPYFIPAPPFILTGTLGAVIRIRQRVPTKRMLFDIGAAGPIAGFVVAVPALALGLSLSRVVPLPDDFVGFTLGEPLLFQFVAWLIWGSAPEGYTLNLHPVGLAAWFGLLVTAIKSVSDCAARWRTHLVRNPRISVDGRDPRNHRRHHCVGDLRLTQLGLLGADDGRDADRVWRQTSSDTR